MLIPIERGTYLQYPLKKASNLSIIPKVYKGEQVRVKTPQGIFFFNGSDFEDNRKMRSNYNQTFKKEMQDQWFNFNMGAKLKEKMRAGTRKRASFKAYIQK